MKHLEVRQKYSAARRIFNSLLGVSSGDETLHLMFDILLPTDFLVSSQNAPPVIDRVIRVCAALVNLFPPILPYD